MSQSDNILWIGKLSRNIRKRDLEDEFDRFGKIIDIEMRNQYAFIEYNNPRDAKHAVKEMDGFKMDDCSIAVTYKQERRKSGRGGPTSNDICYNCGKSGHWANECREGDWKNKCYKCGRYGHVKRDCKYSSRSRSDSRSHSRGYKKSRHQDIIKENIILVQAIVVEVGAIVAGVSGNLILIKSKIVLRGNNVLNKRRRNKHRKHVSSSRSVSSKSKSSSQSQRKKNKEHSERKLSSPRPKAKSQSKHSERKSKSKSKSKTSSKMNSEEKK